MNYLMMTRSQEMMQPKVSNYGVAPMKSLRQKMKEEAEEWKGLMDVSLVFVSTVSSRIVWEETLTLT